jgi:trans-aconitate methyltransferase
MFSESAELYDLIYSGFKNYEAEVAQIEATVKSIHPGAQSVLDVACGTGEHARILGEGYGYQVDGLDIEPEFVRLAQQKNPRGRFWQADMRTFDAEIRYDVILCLFSSIAYVKTIEGVRQTLSHFATHVTENGLIVVEPWYPPEAWKPGSVYMTTVETDDLKVCRMSHSDVKGTLSTVSFEYVVGRPTGLERLREVHELGLFTVDQMQACFAEAELSVAYDDVGPSGRGLYLATKV